MIPLLNSQGDLPPGAHVCSGDEFIQRFCTTGGHRSSFAASFVNILEFAVNNRAKHVFVGGSFVTAQIDPGDLDVLIVFEKEGSVPYLSDHLEDEDCDGLDVMICSLQNRTYLDAFIKLFTERRYSSDVVGVLQIDLYGDAQPWSINYNVDANLFRTILQAYGSRAVIHSHRQIEVVVSVHGLYSLGHWNSYLAPIISAENRIFAPFFYDENDWRLMFFSKRRKDVLGKFRQYIEEVSNDYGLPVSVIAHSFGTYLVTSYIDGFSDTPVKFKSLIFAGSIVNHDFDWNTRRKFFGTLLNHKSPNDEWVKYMPSDRRLKRDPLFGKAGLLGFSRPCPAVTNQEDSNLLHTNIVEKDIIRKRWIPFLNA